MFFFIREEINGGILGEISEGISGIFGRFSKTLSEKFLNKSLKKCMPQKFSLIDAMAFPNSEKK